MSISFSSIVLLRVGGIVCDKKRFLLYRLSNMSCHDGKSLSQSRDLVQCSTLMPPCRYGVAAITVIALSPYAKLDGGKYSIEKSEMKISESKSGLYR
jgi:hypothetical protein